MVDMDRQLGSNGWVPYMDTKWETRHIKRDVLGFEQIKGRQTDAVNGLGVDGRGWWHEPLVSPLERGWRDDIRAGSNMDLFVCLEQVPWVVSLEQDAPCVPQDGDTCLPLVRSGGTRCGTTLVDIHRYMNAFWDIGFSPLPIIIFCIGLPSANFSPGYAVRNSRFPPLGIYR